MMSIAWLTYDVLAAVAVGTLLLLAVLPLLQVIAARGYLATAAAQQRRARTAILVPAHDEVGVIAATLASLMPQLSPGDRLFVIADNCTDDTAAVARGLGANVVERTDSTLRGKGHALAYGLRQLDTDPPEIVITFDADCTVSPDCVKALASATRRTGRPAQARYLLRRPNDVFGSRFAEFALRVRNWARPLGMHRLGLPCQLTGSGMAFTWDMLQHAGFASSHLAEDLQLGLRLAREGLPPVFCPEAIVDSLLVADRSASRVQRTRWEHGHLALAFSEIPDLLRQALRRRDSRLLWLAWDVAVPPFALMVAAECIVLAATGVAAAVGGPWLLFGVASLAPAMTVITLAVARRSFANDLLTWSEITIGAPRYVLRKIPLYVRFVIRRQVEWVRTKRDLP